MTHFEKAFKKVLSLSNLQNGWFYGAGQKIPNSLIYNALRLLIFAGEFGYDDADAAPGENGELQVITYSGLIRCEITFETNGEVDFVFENNGNNLHEAKVNDFETALFLFEQCSRNLCNGLDSLTAINFLPKKTDSQVWHLRTAVGMGASLFSKRIVSKQTDEPSVSTYDISIPIILMSRRSSGYSIKRSYPTNPYLTLMNQEETHAITT